MKIGLLKETYANETRVSLTPEGVKKLVDLKNQVFFEKTCGEGSGFTDAEYEQSGGISMPKSEILQSCHLFVTVSGLLESDILQLKENSVVLGGLKLQRDPRVINVYNQKKITTFALEHLPRITRAQGMDILSSQSNLAGYRSVIEAAFLSNHSFPLMMTAAGTIKPARVLVIGAGVAGLQAIATAKRLGAIVSAFDVRSAAKEQVESLGATFVEVDAKAGADSASGYAKEMSEEYKHAQMTKLSQVLQSQDIVITTALIPGKKAPVLITKQMVSLMKKGAVIVDLASENGGNCEMSRHGETVSVEGVVMHAPFNILKGISFDASQTFSRNIYTFITSLLKEQDEQVIYEERDEIIKGVLITGNGEIHNPLYHGI